MKFFTVPGDIAIEKAVSSTGQTKRFIVCGESAGEAAFLEDPQKGEGSWIDEDIFSSRRPAKEILDQTGKLSASRIFDEARAYIEGRIERGAQARDDLEGSWKSAIQTKKTKPSFIAHKKGFWGKPMDRVLMAEIQVENPWDVLAHFGYRVWYESPRVEEHCAIWQHWAKTYNAHIVCVTHDHLEAQVYKPPATKLEAMQLAWEHHYYCPDTADCIADYAASMLDADYWHFWWD